MVVPNRIGTRFILGVFAVFSSGQGYLRYSAGIAWGRPSPPPQSRVCGAGRGLPVQNIPLTAVCFQAAVRDWLIVIKSNRSDDLDLSASAALAIDGVATILGAHPGAKANFAGTFNVALLVRVMHDFSVSLTSSFAPADRPRRLLSHMPCCRASRLPATKSDAARHSAWTR